MSIVVRNAAGTDYTVATNKGKMQVRNSAGTDYNCTLIQPRNSAGVDYTAWRVRYNILGPADVQWHSVSPAGSRAPVFTGTYIYTYADTAATNSVASAWVDLTPYSTLYIRYNLSAQSGNGYSAMRLANDSWPWNGTTWLAGQMPLSWVENTVSYNVSNFNQGCWLSLHSWSSTGTAGAYFYEVWAQ